MNPKSVITFALLLFVGACAVALAVNGLNHAGSEAGGQVPAASLANSGSSGNPGSAGSPGVAGQGSQAGGAASQAAPASGTWVQAVYFHGNMRCPTCRRIEQYAHEAVHSAFAEELQSGKLRWKVVNYEEPGNRLYLWRYQLVAPTLVLVEMDGTQEVKYENLMQVWGLAGNQQAFFKFVQDRVRAMLGEASG